MNKLKLLLSISLLILGFTTELQARENRIDYEEQFFCSDSSNDPSKACPSDLNGWVATKIKLDDPNFCDLNLCMGPQMGPAPSAYDVIFTIYNVDLGTAQKLRITVNPDPFGMRFSIPDLTIKSIPITEEDIEIANFAYEAKRQIDIYEASLNYTISNGRLFNSDGEDLGIDFGDICTTAINYSYNDNTCAGDLNNQIRDTAMQNLHLIDDMRQTLFVSVAMKTFIFFVDWSGMSTRRPIFKFDDGSVLVIDTEVVDGKSVRITVDADASMTASGETLAGYLGSPNQSPGSLEEAISYGANTFEKLNCEAANMPVETVRITTTRVRLPGGTWRYISVYKFGTKYVTLKLC